MVRLLRSGFSVLVVTGSVVLLGCGGGDGSGSPTPPEETLQSVLVQVTTTGNDLDPDGYTVRLGSRTTTVQVNGATTFGEVSPGTYDVTLEGVASNCTVQGNAVRSVTVTSTSGAQVSFAVECIFDFGDGLATVACEGLVLGASSAVPLDRVAVGTVQAGFDPPLAARVLTPDGAFFGYAWFEVDEEGQVEMVTPLHPSGTLGGGDVLIRMTDGAAACEPFEFTIEELPPSPGELGAIVSLLQDVLRQQAAVLETTPEELMATPLEEVAEVLLPMAIVQYVLDHPEMTSRSGGSRTGQRRGMSLWT